MDLLPLVELVSTTLPSESTWTLAHLPMDPPSPSPGVYPDWNAPPQAPPGLDTYAPTWIGWGYWLAGFIAFFGLIGAAVMMMIGRMGARSAVSADGLRHALWVMGGSMVAASATAVLTGLFS